MLLIVSVFSLVASAQNCNVDFLGTKTLYKNSGQKNTPPPAGYAPVFINHVGRHGARHLTKDVSSTLAWKVLLKADSAAALTEKGKKLLLMVNALQKIEKGNTKSISAEGANELKVSGERMYTEYPAVFKGHIDLKVATTKEVRTKQSADAFLQGLSSKLADTAVINFYNDDTNLRFYDLSPAYKQFEDNVDKSDLTLSFEKKEHLDEINHSVAGRIFNGAFFKNLDATTQAKFVTDVFGFATIVYSLNNEIIQAGLTPGQLDFQSFFTCDELRSLALLDAADEYLKKGPSTNNDGIQVRVAVPLLVDFINAADDYIKSSKYNARLRFAHAETIAPFAALLRISSADKVAVDLTYLSDSWQASKVIPLSSNIQWVFYKSKSKPGYLVKILLNEKEEHITGLNTAMFPYYKWSDLRAFYMAKLNKLNVQLGEDMNKYLNTVQ